MPLTENQHRALKAESKFVSYLISSKSNHGLDLPTDVIQKFGDEVMSIVNATLEDMMPSEPTTTAKPARLLPAFDPSRIERKLEEAKADYEAGLAKVRRPNGEPMYAPDIQRDKESAVSAAYTHATDAIVTDLESKIAEAEAELKTLGREPLFRLNADDLARAGQLRPFVMDEAERLDVKHLVELAEQAIVAKDRPLMVLYHRALRFLVEGAQQQTIANGGTMPRRFSQAAQGAAPMIERLGALLADPQDAERRERAEANIAAARKVRTGIVTKAMTEQYLQQAYGRRT